MLVSGITSMALEMAAARLLAPFFGTSLYIWGILIGLILVYLTAGYSLGGKLADRAPRPAVFFALNGLAAVAVALDGLLATPVLSGSLGATEGLPFGLYAGALAGCLALFAIPVIMLGCVSPFAIRLRVSGVQQAGQASGAVFALTTIGSLIGTFGAVFWLIPSAGTRVTLYAAAGLLLLCAAFAWLTTRRA